MDTEKLLFKFRCDIKGLEYITRNQRDPHNADFIKTQGKIELIQEYMKEISNGEWDEEE